MQVPATCRSRILDAAGQGIISCRRSNSDCPKRCIAKLTLLFYNMRCPLSYNGDHCRSDSVEEPKEYR